MHGRRSDKSCNILGKEQLSIVSKYTIGDKINKSFTKFVEISSVSVGSISAASLAQLSRVGIILRKLVIHGYDGASTKAGHMSGVQKRIRDKHLRVIFVHCAT